MLPFMASRIEDEKALNKGVIRGYIEYYLSNSTAEVGFVEIFKWFGYSQTWINITREIVSKEYPQYIDALENLLLLM